jgi:small-conductance mechanosensitive channel
MQAAREQARVLEEQLGLARERALAAESKVREKRARIYRKLLQTALVFLGGYLLIFLVVGIINNRVEDIKVRHLMRKNVIYLMSVLIMVFIFFIWIQDINSITVILSVLGAGIALALQEAILCVAGWILVLVRRPFEVGDRIELGGVRGDVIDIRLFQTALLEIGNWVDADQSTGRIVNVPNSAVFKREIYNYNRGFEFIWNEISVEVTFESDWKSAEAIMMEHAAREAGEIAENVRRKILKMTRRYMIHYGKLTPIVYVKIVDSGVRLTLRYLTEARKRRATEDSLTRDILDGFEKAPRVQFAYTTYRIVRTDG